MMRLSLNGVHRGRLLRMPALCLAIGLTVGCSSDKKQSFDGALTAVRSKTNDSLDRWAAAVSKTLGDQLRMSGKISQSEALEKLRGDTDDLADEICGVIAKEGRTLGSVDNSAKASDALRTSVVEAVVDSIGSDLLQLNDLKVQFPAFMLVNPSSNPPFGADPSSLSPTYLSSYLRQEFVNESGGARFPNEADPQYEEFARWTRSDNNSLGSRAAYFSADLLRQVDECLLATRKK